MSCRRARADSWDAVVVGGGPAGLSAAFYLARGGFRVIILERARLGGKLPGLGVVRTYPGFPEGIDGAALARRLKRQARAFGARARRGEALLVERGPAGLRVRLRGGGALRCRAAVVATGARFRSLGVPGEEGLLGRGVYHAAFARAAAQRGRSVGVIGGGEAAAHQALALARHARSVRLFVRAAGLKATRALRDALARARAVSLVPGARVIAFAGRRRLRGLVWRPAGGGEARAEPLDAAFVLVGQCPNRPALRARRGVFLAGDARPAPVRHAAAAAADGLAAGLACERFLEAR